MSTSAERSDPHSRHLSHLRVLIVDHDFDAAKDSVESVRKCGHEPAAAHSGRDAITAASKFQPHVVLLELALVDMDPFKLARRLRGAAMVIAVTKLGTRYHKRRSHETGLLAHLSKPVDGEWLCRLLDMCLEKLRAAGGVHSLSYTPPFSRGRS